MRSAEAQAPVAIPGMEESPVEGLGAGLLWASQCDGQVCEGHSTCRQGARPDFHLRLLAWPLLGRRELGSEPNPQGWPGPEQLARPLPSRDVIGHAHRQCSHTHTDPHPSTALLSQTLSCSHWSTHLTCTSRALSPTHVCAHVTCVHSPTHSHKHEHGFTHTALHTDTYPSNPHRLLDTLLHSPISH